MHPQETTRKLNSPHICGYAWIGMCGALCVDA